MEIDKIANGKWTTKLPLTKTNKRQTNEFRIQKNSCDINDGNCMGQLQPRNNIFEK